MNRRKFIYQASISSMALLIPNWISKSQIPSIQAIEHIRHGYLDFDMNHPNVLQFKGSKIRVDQLYANGHSPNLHQDLFIVSIEKNGKHFQDMQQGFPNLEKYF